MLFYMTENHHELLKRVFPTMSSFYSNDLGPIFSVIGKEYGTLDMVKDSVARFEDVPVTAAVPVQVKKIDSLWLRFRHEAVQKKFNEEYCWIFPIDDAERKLMSKILDVFSRVVMGQFFIIYEELDIDLAGDPAGNQALWQAYHDALWRGAGGINEIRGTLIPDLATNEWHGGFGICNTAVAESSRLAYQMHKVLERDSLILRVTAEPLAKLSEE